MVTSTSNAAMSAAIEIRAHCWQLPKWINPIENVSFKDFFFNFIFLPWIQCLFAKNPN